MIRIAYLMDQNRVFDGDDDDQRPKDKRYDPQHSVWRYLTIGACGLYRHAERIERARANVAEDNTHAGKRRRCPSVRMAGVVHGASFWDRTHEQ
jgi:hypothetical protein